MISCQQCGRSYEYGTGHACTGQGSGQANSFAVCFRCGQSYSHFQGHQCVQPVNVAQPERYPSADTQYFTKTIVELSKELGQLKAENERFQYLVKKKDAELCALRTGKE